MKSECNASEQGGIETSLCVLQWSCQEGIWNDLRNQERLVREQSQFL